MSKKTNIDLLSHLESKVNKFNTPEFIATDPISIPHSFSKKQDIEIASFFAAIFSWGQRKTIINKSKELLNLMDNSPHNFILEHKEKDLKRFLGFKHRTFNATDTLYFIHFLLSHYSKNNSLETAFSDDIKSDDSTIEKGLIHFRKKFFSLPDFPKRTMKHISSPESKSTCKRLNMFLRWMVRKDKNGVDFGLWKKIKPSQLVCPLDVHVERVARNLGLIKRKQTDWLTAIELTENLKKFDPDDPVKYDFALFGMGISDYRLQITS